MNFIFSLYFWLSLGFESTYLILTRTQTVTLLSIYGFEVF